MLQILLDAHIVDEPTIGLADAAVVAVIVGLIQVIRTAWPALPSRFMPLIAVSSGIAWQVAVAFSYDDPVWATVVISGLVLGLASSGLYSGGKVLIESASSDE